MMHNLNESESISNNNPLVRAGYAIDLALGTDHLEQVIFGVPSTSGETKELFSLLIRPGGTYIWFAGGKGLYFVGRSEHLWELTDELLHALRDPVPQPELQLTGLFSKYMIRRVQEWEFLEEARERESKLHRDMGWRHLSTDEHVRLWDVAINRLRLTSESAGVSHIIPPAPWVEWSLPDPIKVWRFDRVGHRAREFYRQFHLAVLRGLRCNLRKGEIVYCLDLHHQAYVFDPADENAELYVDWWPVSPVPCGEYVLFGDAEFGTGMYTDPADQSVCAFGGSFPHSIDEVLSSGALGTVTELRRSGSMQ
jgi:hypothetical protein